jgi:hypothetical protein
MNHHDNGYDVEAVENKRTNLSIFKLVLLCAISSLIILAILLIFMRNQHGIDRGTSANATEHDLTLTPTRTLSDSKAPANIPPLSKTLHSVLSPVYKWILRHKWILLIIALVLIALLVVMVAWPKAIVLTGKFLFLSVMSLGEFAEWLGNVIGMPFKALQEKTTSSKS